MVKNDGKGRIIFFLYPLYYWAFQNPLLRENVLFICHLSLINTKPLKYSILSNDRWLTEDFICQHSLFFVYSD